MCGRNHSPRLREWTHPLPLQPVIFMERGGSGCTEQDNRKGRGGWGRATVRGIDKVRFTLMKIVPYIKVSLTSSHLNRHRCPQNLFVLSFIFYLPVGENSKENSEGTMPEPCETQTRPSFLPEHRLNACWKQVGSMAYGRILNILNILLIWIQLLLAKGSDWGCLPFLQLIHNGAFSLGKQL